MKKFKRTNNEDNVKSKHKIVDFSSLTKKELSALDKKWHSKAMKLEFALENAIRFNKDNKAVTNLHQTANKFWGRIRALQNFMKKTRDA